MTARIPVFYDRELRPEWIDYALERFVESSDALEFRQQLRRHLSPQITCATSLRKVISQLDQTVGYRSQLSREQLVRMYEAMSALPPSDRAPRRLQLLVKSNRFVADCVSAIRKLHRVGVDGIESKHLYERLGAIYGERGTVPRRVRYVLRTLANLGMLENRDKRWFVVGLL